MIKIIMTVIGRRRHLMKMMIMTMLLLRSVFFSGLRVGPSFCFPHCTHCCSQPISDFGGQCVSACYLSVSGPLDFRLVIQVLFGPRMFLNACARRPDLGLTSHPNDAALPQE